jgi:hypothetical protein
MGKEGHVTMERRTCDCRPVYQDKDGERRTLDSRPVYQDKDGERRTCYYGKNDMILWKEGHVTVDQFIKTKMGKEGHLTADQFIKTKMGKEDT